MNFESVCVKDDSYKQTETTMWIGKQPYNSFYLVKLDPGAHFFLKRQSQSSHLVFITALEGLATQSKTPMKLNFIEVKTAIKINLCAILEQLNQRRNRAKRVSYFVDDCIVEEEKDLSTQFLKMRKNQLIDLQEQFERYCNVLPVFGFNSANSIITRSSRICYQFFQMGEILNRQL